ncbi:hypothetical protein DB30_01195 [Enhygromyxa salina]|uniref:Uncharacterized protein n=1 Tax=Enhygromyxa salina TaxID=215803 RepID=A0A0C2CSM2_9BACT|nr:hypothetical protein DB30_01195 [Enhygromyxa salina]
MQGGVDDDLSTKRALVGGPCAEHGNGDRLGEDYGGLRAANDDCAGARLSLL